MKVFILVLMSVALAACGGGGDDPGESEAKPRDDLMSACLVKPTPTGQASQPLPSSCAAK